MNAYPRLSVFKRNVLGDSKVSVPGAEREDRMLELLEAVSREFDKDTRNPMFAKVATMYPDLREGCDKLWLRPFVSLSSVAIDKDDDGTFSQTLTEGTDFETWADPSDEGGPYLRLDRIRYTTTFSGWPGRKRVRCTGIFGYSNEKKATGVTVPAGGLAADATTFAAGKGHGIDLGETLMIGSEQICVDGATGNGDLTLTRAINGTTAAAHAQGTVVYRRVYPADVVMGVLERARYLWHNEFRGGQEPDSLGFATSSWPRWKRLTGKYEIATAP